MELRERVLTTSDSAVVTPSFPPSNPSPVPACPQHALTRLLVSGAAEIPARQDLGRMRSLGVFHSAPALAASRVRSLPFYQHMPRLLTHTFVLATLGQTRWPGSSPSSPAARSEQAAREPSRGPGTLPSSLGSPHQPLSAPGWLGRPVTMKERSACSLQLQSLLSTGRGMTVGVQGTPARAAATTGHTAGMLAPPLARRGGTGRDPPGLGRHHGERRRAQIAAR